MCVCGSLTTITLNCVHRSSPNWVCDKGNDRPSPALHFGRPAPSGRGSAAGRNFFWLQRGCVSSECFLPMRYASSFIGLRFSADVITLEPIFTGYSAVNMYMNALFTLLYIVLC